MRFREGVLYLGSTWEAPVVLPTRHATRKKHITRLAEEMVKIELEFLSKLAYDFRKMENYGYPLVQPPHGPPDEVLPLRVLIQRIQYLSRVLGKEPDQGVIESIRHECLRRSTKSLLRHLRKDEYNGWPNQKYSKKNFATLRRRMAKGNFMPRHIDVTTRELRRWAKVLQERVPRCIV